MPALKAYPPPIELTQPARRRVWSHPELQSHSLMALTLSDLYVVPLTEPPRADIVEAAESGADVDEILGPLATVVPLSAVHRAKLDLLANTLLLEYWCGRSSLHVGLKFASPEAADACFSRIWRGLGEGCRVQPSHPKGWPVARIPLTLLAAIFAVTAMLSLAITTSDDLSTAQAAASVNIPGEEHPMLVSRSPLQVLIGWMDWRVICAFGGAAAAGTQVWLYRRLTVPPISLEVIRG
jgi:hypothetical protein